MQSQKSYHLHKKSAIGKVSLHMHIEIKTRGGVGNNDGW
jgi:hypothetical protein